MKINKEILLIILNILIIFTCIFLFVKKFAQEKNYDPLKYGDTAPAYLPLEFINNGAMDTEKSYNSILLFFNDQLLDQVQGISDYFETAPFMKNVKIIGIYADKKGKSRLTLLNSFSFPVYHDTDFTVTKKFRVDPLRQNGATIIIDKHNMVIFSLQHIAGAELIKQFILTHFCI